MRVSIKQDVECNHGARTLKPNDLGENPSGWTIMGKIWEDYYEWVNYFEASHPTFGWVRGDYEDVVEAKSMKAYKHFIAHHPPNEWDYGDI